ncbi:MAG: restriction endonuclease [Armatimonadota bacterium]|jgi:Uma2 family endonuclease|nr:MAG: restriction endonuclease [Armatimonadota bacterium]
MAIVAPSRRVRMTRQEFEQLPPGPPYYDYIGGEAIEVNRPSGRHQQLVVWLASSLWQFVRQAKLGEVWVDINVELPTGDVLSPDIVYLRKEHLSSYDEAKGYIVGTPDLVVEILSPSTAAYDRVEKFDAYRRAGVPWVWLVDQETLVVEEYQWTPEGYLCVQTTSGSASFHPRLFAGWQARPEEVFLPVKEGGR